MLPSDLKNSDSLRNLIIPIIFIYDNYNKIIKNCKIKIV